MTVTIIGDINAAHHSVDISGTVPVYITGPRQLSGLRILAEQNVTVDTSQDELKGGSTREASRVGVMIENQSSSITVRIGITGVTSSTGELLLPGEKMFYPIGDQGLFGITASSSAVVHVKELGP